MEERGTDAGSIVYGSAMGLGCWFGIRDDNWEQGVTKIFSLGPWENYDILKEITKLGGAAIF